MRNKASSTDERGRPDEGSKERINLHVAAETAQKLKHCAVDERVRIGHLAEALIGLGLRDPAVRAKAVAAARGTKKKG